MLSRATLAVATACTLSVAIGVVDAGTNIPELGTVRVTAGLQLPVFATHAPGDSTRLFILEKQEP